MNKVSQYISVSKCYTKNMDQLDAKTRNLLSKMHAKGYKCVAQIQANDEDYGSPLFFNAPADVTVLIQKFPAYATACVKWCEEIHIG